MSAQLGVKRVASLDGGQLRCLAGRRMIGVDISTGGGYTILRRFWREYLRTPCSGEGGGADYLLFLHIQQIVQVRSAICVVSDQKRAAIDCVVVYGFFAFRTGTANMEQLHRSSPSAVYVRAVGIHQPRQACILDTGCLLWYIVFSEFNVCQQPEGSHLRAGQQAIEFAAVPGEVLRRGVKADSKSAVLQHRTPLFSLQALGKRRQEVYNTRNRTGKPEKGRQPHVLSGIPGIF